MRSSGLRVVLVSSVVVTLVSCAPTRSPEAFCGVVDEYTEELQANVTSADGGLSEFLAVFENVGIFRNMLIDLAEVSPDEIRTDVEVVRDQYVQMIDEAGDAASDPLGGIAGMLALALFNGQSYQRIDQYSQANCGVTVFGPAPQGEFGPTPPGATTTTLPPWCGGVRSVALEFTSLDLSADLQGLLSDQSPPEFVTAVEGLITGIDEAVASGAGTLGEALVLSADGPEHFADLADQVNEAASLCRQEVFSADDIERARTITPRRNGNSVFVDLDNFYGAECPLGNTGEWLSSSWDIVAGNVATLYCALDYQESFEVVGIDLDSLVPVRVAIPGLTYPWRTGGGLFVYTQREVVPASGLTGEEVVWTAAAIDVVSGQEVWRREFPELDTDPGRQDELVVVNGVTSQGVAVLSLYGEQDDYSYPEPLGILAVDAGGNEIERRMAKFSYMAGPLVVFREGERTNFFETGASVYNESFEPVYQSEEWRLAEAIDLEHLACGRFVLSTLFGDHLLVHPESGVSTAIEELISESYHFVGSSKEGVLFLESLSDTYRFYRFTGAAWEIGWELEGGVIDELQVVNGQAVVVNTAGQLVAVNMATGTEDRILETSPLPISNGWTWREDGRTVTFTSTDGSEVSSCEDTDGWSRGD